MSPSIPYIPIQIIQIIHIIHPDQNSTLHTRRGRGRGDGRYDTYHRRDTYVSHTQSLDVLHDMSLLPATSTVTTRALLLLLTLFTLAGTTSNSTTVTTPNSTTVTANSNSHSHSHSHHALPCHHHQPSHPASQPSQHLPVTQPSTIVGISHPARPTLQLINHTKLLSSLIPHPLLLSPLPFPFPSNHHHNHRQTIQDTPSRTRKTSDTHAPNAANKTRPSAPPL